MLLLLLNESSGAQPFRQWKIDFHSALWQLALYLLVAQTGNFCLRPKRSFLFWDLPRIVFARSPWKLISVRGDYKSFLFVSLCGKILDCLVISGEMYQGWNSYCELRGCGYWLQIKTQWPISEYCAQVSIAILHYPISHINHKAKHLMYKSSYRCST